MEFDRKFSMFPLWGRIVFWALAIGSVAAMVAYVVLYGSATLDALLAAVGDLL